MTLLERIAEIDKEMARTQKNKATEKSFALLRARKSKLQTELLKLEATQSKSGGGAAFEVQKVGAARITLVGYPSTGKSSLLNYLCNTHSAVSPIDFTTLTAVPGSITYHGCQIQLIDLPGIIDDAQTSNAGKGRQVIATARTCDLMFIFLSATNSMQLKRNLEGQLSAAGIRINKRIPKIYITRKEKGGISIQCQKELTNLNDSIITAVLAEYKIFNCEIRFEDADATVDELVDVIEGNRVYIPALYVVNKVDSITLEELQLFDQLPNWVPISVKKGWNIDELLEKMWKKLNMIRIYTKPRGGPVDLGVPVILRCRKQKPTVEAFCQQIHKDLADQMKYAIVWGRSAKHMGQRVGKQHILMDEDVVTIVTQ